MSHPTFQLLCSFLLVAGGLAIGFIDPDESRETFGPYQWVGLAVVAVGLLSNQF